MYGRIAREKNPSNNPPPSAEDFSPAQPITANRAVFFESLATKYNSPLSALFRLVMENLLLDDLTRLINHNRLQSTSWFNLTQTKTRLKELGTAGEDLIIKLRNIHKSTPDIEERKAACVTLVAELVDKLDSLTINMSKFYNYDSFVTEAEKELIQSNFARWIQVATASASAPVIVNINNNNISTTNEPAVAPPVSTSTTSISDDLRNFDLDGTFFPVFFAEDLDLGALDDAVFFAHLAAEHQRTTPELFRLIMANLLLEDLNQLVNHDNLQNMPWFNLVYETKRLEKLEGGTTGAKVLTQLREINKRTTDKTERKNACVIVANELVSEFSTLLETNSNFYTYDDFVTAAEQKAIRADFARWTHIVRPLISAEDPQNPYASPPLPYNVEEDRTHANIYHLEAVQAYTSVLTELLKGKKLPETFASLSAVIAFVENYIQDTKLPGILFFVPEPEINQLRELKKEMVELERTLEQPVPASAPPAVDILTETEMRIAEIMAHASAPPLSPPSSPSQERSLSNARK